jgi:uncharacterized protein YneF (UPF0154 family)
LEIKTPVAVAIIVVVVLIAGFFIWRGTGSARFGKPPPITTGLSLAPGQAPGGVKPGGPQIQTNMPTTLPSGPGTGQAEYRPGK